MSVKKRHAEIEPGLLQDCVDRLRSASTLDEVVAILRSSARRLVGADGIAIVLREGDQCHYVEEDAVGPLWKGERFPSESCVSGWAMTHRQTVVIPDILFDPRVPQEAYRKTFVRSMVMVPFGRGEALGAIGAYWAHANAPSAADVDTLETVADAVGDALSGMAGAQGEHGSAAAASRHPRPGVTPLPARMLMRLIPARMLPFWRGQLLAAGLVAGLGLIRAGLTPFLGGSVLFTWFLPAILAAALWGGSRAAATAVVLSTAAGAAIEIGLVSDGNLWPRALGWLVFALTAGLTAAVASIARAAMDTQQLRGQALERRDWQLAQIVRELDHRTRNTLTVIMALVRQASKSSTTPKEMSDTLLGQISSMVDAQRLLLAQGLDGLPLRRLLEVCLQPFMGGNRIDLALNDELTVPDGAEEMMCLALHELATNAVKYGALSVPGGEVRVSGELSGDRVVVEWSESGGPKVVAPRQRGSGTRLIERALGAVPDARVELDYVPAGLRCRFSWRDPEQRAAVARVAG